MLKKIIVYGIGIFFSKALVFLLVPLYTRCFSPADYGYYDVLTSNIVMLVSVTFIEIWSGVLRYMFDDEEKYRPIKTFLIILPFLLIIYGIAFCLYSFIGELKFPLLSIFYGLCYLLFSVYNSICRGLNRNIDYVLSGVISTSLACGLGVLFVLVFHRGISSLLVSQIIGYSCAVIFMELRTKAICRSFKVHTSKKNIKNMLLYCVPLMINSFSFLFLGTFNKNIVINRLGETASGYYALVLKFTSILSIVISIFSLAWQEVAFSQINNENREQIYSYYINVFIKFAGLAIPIYCLVLYYFSPIVGGSNFVKATQFIPLAVVATFIAELSGIFSIIIAAIKQSWHILISTIIAAAVNVAVILLTISKLDINAASLGLMVGYLCAAIYRFAVAKNKTGIKLQFRYFMIISLETGLVFISFIFYSLWLMIAAIVACSGVWFVINYKEIRATFSRIRSKIRKMKTESNSDTEIESPIESPNDDEGIK